MAEHGKSMFDRGMTFGSSGNISVRVNDGWLLTPTNSCLGRLDPSEIAKLDRDWQHVSGAPPSKELFLHRAMYEDRAAIEAIVHLHSTYSVAVSCLPDVDPENVLPPLTAYYVMKIGRLPLVPYFRPGDMSLAEAIRGLAGRPNAVLLANHGPIVGASSLDAAVYAMEELEETAKLYLLLRNCHPRCLNEDQIDELRRVFCLP